jgi:hypothetical protein
MRWNQLAAIWLLLRKIRELGDVAFEMGLDHGDRVVGGGAAWILRVIGSSRGCGSISVLYFPRHLPGSARPGIDGRQSGKRLENMGHTSSSNE